MNVPKELMYTKSHEWVKTVDDTTVTVGLTDYAQDALGDLVFVNLPEPGDDVTAGEAFSDVESVKAVSDVLSPVTGQVEEINEELLDSPESVNPVSYTHLDVYKRQVRKLFGRLFFKVQKKPHNIGYEIGRNHHRLFCFIPGQLF